jgi:hypothetical protein
VQAAAVVSTYVAPVAGRWATAAQQALASALAESGHTAEAIANPAAAAAI